MQRSFPRLSALSLLLAGTAACGARTIGLSAEDFEPAPDGGGPVDSSALDSTRPDLGVEETSFDGFIPDSGAFDSSAIDTHLGDTGLLDTGGFDSGAFDSGSIDTGIVDGGPPDVLGFPADHPAAPRAVSEGGRVLSTPRLVPIVFAGDPWAGQLATFVSTMASPTAASWWTAAGSEYGVGLPTSAPLITVAETPPTAIDNDAIATWLSGKLDGTHPEFGAADPTAIYTIFYPETTSITLMGSASCTDFGGYHNQATLASGTSVAFAVLPRCSGFVPGATDFEGVTAATSHEWIEAATDPFIFTKAAFDLPDGDHLAWRIFPGTEVGDMCSDQQTSFYMSSIGYELQRIWSNSAAAASHDPCVPASGAVYFNSAPVLTDDVTIDFGEGKGPEATKGAKIAIGASKTIEVDLFSDAPTSGAWTVQAFDIGALLGGTPSLSFSWDRTSGKNGDKLHLTIRVTGDGFGGGSEFAIRSTLGTTRHYWYGLVAR